MRRAPVGRLFDSSVKSRCEIRCWIRPMHPADRRHLSACRMGVSAGFFSRIQPTELCVEGLTKLCTLNEGLASQHPSARHCLHSCVHGVQDCVLQQKMTLAVWYIRKH